MDKNGEIVRASGICCACDFKFVDEVVARFPDRAMPGGWAYFELRHLEELGLPLPGIGASDDPAS